MFPKNLELFMEKIYQKNIIKGMDIQTYSDKSFVVRGDATKKYKELFVKKYNGKWNRNLNGGPGWIFSNSHLAEIMELADEVDITEKNEEKDVDPIEFLNQQATKKCRINFEGFTKKDATKMVNFCKVLHYGDEETAIELYDELPKTIQCLFAENAANISLHAENMSFPKKSIRLSEKINDFIKKYKKGLYEKHTLKLNKTSKKSSSKSRSPSPKSRSRSSSKSSKSRSRSSSKSPSKSSGSSKSPSKSSGSSKSSSKSSGSSKKKYDKEYQKYAMPSETDPVNIFYASLYDEKPDSKLAITWLTEHGVFDDEEREKIVKKYKKLAEKNQLIK